MGFWTAVVVIVAIIAFATMRIARYRAGLGADWNQGQQGMGQDLPGPREAELTREVEELRDRIAVLERIATEDRHGKAIAAEIESLREK